MDSIVKLDNTELRKPKIGIKDNRRRSVYIMRVLVIVIEIPRFITVVFLLDVAQVLGLYCSSITAYSNTAEEYNLVSCLRLLPIEAFLKHGSFVSCSQDHVHLTHCQC